MDARQSLAKLKAGNAKYLTATTNPGNISVSIRKQTATQGQTPYAVIICCSDSRVVPEAIFSTGIGELFVIRVAGNVIDNTELGSIEYAVGHLHTPLVVLLGHTQCGAIATALSGHADGHALSLVDKIHLGIGEEKDPTAASKLNVLYGIDVIKKLSHVHAEVVGALYHVDTGSVEWL